MLSDGRLLLNRPFGVEVHIFLGTIYTVRPQIIDSSLERSERSAVSLGDQRLRIAVFIISNDGFARFSGSAGNSVQLLGEQDLFLVRFDCF